MDIAGDDLTPRDLLSVGPTDYVARRDELVKAARTAGAKETAKFLKGLARPGLALWVALVAAEDASAVSAALGATARLAAIQAAGGSPAEVGAAAAERRRRIDTLVSAGMARLAQHGGGGAARTAEVAALLDQLTRHPELEEHWLDGSLRHLPDAELGFDAFAELAVAAPVRVRPTPRTPADRPRPRPTVEPAAEPAPEIDDRAERRAAADVVVDRAVAAEGRAGAVRADAARVVSRLEQELNAARTALERAQAAAVVATDAVDRARRERAALEELGDS